MKTLKVLSLLTVGMSFVFMSGVTMFAASLIIGTHGFIACELLVVGLIGMVVGITIAAQAERFV